MPKVPLKAFARTRPGSSPFPSSSLPSGKTLPSRFRTPLILVCISTYGLGAAGFFAYARYLKSTSVSAALDVPLDVSDRYDKTAKTFDSDINFTETISGINWRRRQLAQQAKGYVLESSAGTGRNSEYYRLGGIKRLVMLDQSAEMLKIAEEKFKTQHPSYRNVAFLTQSALDPIPLAPTSLEGYDTVIQTMGLCSTPDPAGMIRNLGKVVKPGSGRILLLEHGRSHYRWMDQVLDATAKGHAAQHGCWWNRDIGKIVGEVVGEEDFGLEVVEMKRYNFGTTWWVELRRKKARGDTEQGEKRVQEAVEKK